MMRLRAALDRHWFAPASLRDLGIVRAVLFGAQTFVFLWLPDARLRPVAEQIHLATAGAARYQPGVLLRALLLATGHAHGPPSPTAIVAAYVVAVAAGVLATVGLWARPAMLTAAAANAAIVAHYYAYGEYHHAEALLLLALGVLAVAPSAAAFSLDAARRRRRGDPAPDDRSPFARWPLRLVQWTLALSYLSAAYEKLRVGGLAWFNGYTMSYHYLVVGSAPRRLLAGWMASLPPGWHVPASVFAWTFEALFFVAVLAPRTAWAFVLAGLALHLGIYATMGILFGQTMLLYVAFVEAIRLHPPRRAATRA